MEKESLMPLLSKLTYHPASLEAIIAEMVLQDFLELKDIEFHARSTFARAYSRDIKLAAIEEKDGQEILRLETHREGIYDQLPQGFFHRPKPSRPRDKAEKRIEKYKETRREEAEARRFFLPFEQESFYFTTKAEISERSLIDPFRSSLRNNLLLDIWPSCKNAAESYYPILNYILPLSYRIAGNLQLMSACFSAIAKFSVDMKYVKPEKYELEEGFRDLSINTSMQLGVDLILAGQPSAELPVLEITIGPMDSKSTIDFLEGGEKRDVLNILCDALVPLDVTVHYQFVYKDKHDEFRLGAEGQSSAFLGHTTTLIENDNEV